MKRWINASDDLTVDISKYRPSDSVMKKLMDYRARASKVNVNAIKDPVKLLTYYYGAKLMGWADLAEDIYRTKMAYSLRDEMSAIAKQVSADESLGDTRSNDEIELGISDSKGLFNFDMKRLNGNASCWLPKSFLNYLIENNIPVNFGKRTSGARWDRNGAQWSEVEHLTLFPGTEDEFDYEIVVHTHERADGSIPNTYTSPDTNERSSAKALISGLDNRLRRKGLIPGEDYIENSENIYSKTLMPTKKFMSQLSFDFAHDGYYTNDDIERIVDIALDTCDCALTGLDIHSVDYSGYPEYEDCSVSQCSADFEWDGRKGYSAKVIKEVLDEELSAIGYELVGIDFVSLEEEVR